MHSACSSAERLLPLACAARSFAGSIALPFLTAAVAVCAGLAALSRRARDADLPLYALAGVALWYCLLRGGINADIAGVITAIALPAPPLQAGGDETLLDKLHHALAPWTALLVMPVFALANTAVPLASTSLAALLSAPVAQGIGLGLFLGKPLGIVAFSMVRLRRGCRVRILPACALPRRTTDRLCRAMLRAQLGIKLGLASWPTGMGLKHLLVVGVLGGIGFTMSLFLIQCSFAAAPQLAGTAKLAVLLGSLAAATAGAALLSLFPAHAADEPAKLPVAAPA
jgi:NhaA family Na+:H+ antiporter